MPLHCEDRWYPVLCSGAWYVYDRQTGEFARTAEHSAPSYTSEREALRLIGHMKQAFHAGGDYAKAAIRQIIGIEEQTDA